MTDAFSDDFYGACKDVKFGAANLPAMMFIGGGAKTALEWLSFLGDVKDKRFPPVGSPFQINFHPQNETPAGMDGMTGSMLGCGDPGFTCSCAGGWLWCGWAGALGTCMLQGAWPAQCCLVQHIITALQGSTHGTAGAT